MFYFITVLLRKMGSLHFILANVNTFWDSYECAHSTAQAN
jgi:hypothetical protein